MAPDRIVRDALEDLNRADLDSYYKRMAPSFHYRTPMAVFEGREAARAADEMLFAQMEHHRDVVQLLADGEHVCCWLRFSGRVRSTEKSFDLDLCTVFRVVGDEIAALELYGNFAPMLAAMS